LVEVQKAMAFAEKRSFETSQKEKLILEKNNNGKSQETLTEQRGEKSQETIVQVRSKSIFNTVERF